MQVDFMGYRPTDPVQVHQYVRAAAFRELLPIVPVNESWVKAHFTPEEMLRCSVTFMGFPHHDSSDSLPEAIHTIMREVLTGQDTSLLDTMVALRSSRKFKRR